MPTNHKQTQLIEDKSEASEKMSELGVPDDMSKPLMGVEKQERPYCNDKATAVDFENYIMVTGNPEENTLKITVVSVFEMRNAKSIPDAIMSENEVDVWRRRLLADVSSNSAMLARAFLTVLR